jgi:hypothetical protein
MNLMKSTLSAVLSFRLAIVGLVFAGMFLLAPSALKAQTSAVANFHSVPSGPYVTAPVAITRVEAQILWIKGQYEILDPASQDYRNNEAKYAFYTAILNQLNDGKTVAESIEAALTVFDTDAVGVLPKGKKEEYKQEAINLLRQ